MRQLTVSKDGTRLLLVVPNATPLRAAAQAIPGVRVEGCDSEYAAYSYPASPDTCVSLLDTFEPEVSTEHRGAVQELVTAYRDLEAAAALKASPDSALLSFDPKLQTVPMAHQAAAMNYCAARFAAGAAGTALLMEQGTGKSLVAIGMANYLYSRGLIGWAMVLCPNSLKGTWGASDGEILKHTAPNTACYPIMLRGTRDQRQAYLARVLSTKAVKDGGALPWVITNYDEFAVNIRHGANAQRFRHTIDLVRRSAPGLLVCDESSACKNYKALRTRATMELARHFPYRLILTGTPVECSPLDVWPQFEILEPGCLGYRSALAFEKAYAVYERRVVPTGPAGSTRRSIMVVGGYRNLQDLERRVWRHSFRARADDCLDLPPVVARPIPVELSAEQGRLLSQLKSDLMGELSEGVYLDGRNILTRLQKMQQVGSGWVRTMDAEGRTRQEWQALTPNPKLEALSEYLELALQDPARKVVVFCEHPDTEVRAIATLARRRGWGAVEFHGGVSEEDRDKRRQLFNKDPNTRLFVAQYETAARGLNLAVADTVVFYSLTFRYGTWSQARKRVHRQGQTRRVSEVYLLGEAPRARGGTARTIDHVQLEALQRKQNLADIITGDKAAALLERI